MQQEGTDNRGILALLTGLLLLLILSGMSVSKMIRVQVRSGSASAMFPPGQERKEQKTEVCEKGGEWASGGLGVR